MFRNILAIGCVLAVGVGTAQAASVSTLAQENSTISSWGLPDTAAYGQTFTLGAASVLNSLSFRINDGGTAVDFSAFIFAWGGDRTTGAALFSTGGATAGAASMETVTVGLGNTAVAPGQYVAFFQATSAGSSSWGSVAGLDAYAGGAFVFQNNTGNQGLFGTSPWSTNWQGPGSDLAFELTYDSPRPIPLPAALPLMLVALGGLGIAARRRR